MVKARGVSFSRKAVYIGVSFSRKAVNIKGFKFERPLIVITYLFTC